MDLVLAQFLAAVIVGTLIGIRIGRWAVPDTGLDYTDALIVHRLLEPD